MPSVTVRPPTGTSRASSAIPPQAADADVVLLTVPDRAIAEVAAGSAGRAVGRATSPAPRRWPRSATSPRRFVLHPAQSMERDGGAAQLDGVSAFTTGADPEAERFAADLASSLGLRAVPIPESVRPLPHIACVIGAAFVVTLFATACRLLDRDDAVEILAPLARRALENAIAAGPAMQPTGPVARGDAPTIAAHLAALERLDPALTAALPRAGARDPADRRPGGRGAGWRRCCENAPHHPRGPRRADERPARPSAASRSCRPWARSTTATCR